ncbi:MAG: tRNA (N(6)-L-threonylcarbamoyladenosine(37)-C(2))-methylthiotransferase MtaB [Desulfobacterota bacterium]|nr:tRNA (N(6)-L-threonylcarbamoyladenosine(37)-C(2))-methylthiotransferase MtaB [Thermodesulfobacteriota bacterium]
MKTVSIATVGCKANQFDSEALLEQLRALGYRPVPFESGADVMIINTCTVTHRADFDSRQMVRRALRRHPGSIVIVTGCYVQADPETFAKMGGVRYLFGNREKFSIPSLLPQLEKGGLPKIQVGDIHRERTFVDLPVYRFSRRTRASLKIQEGCDHRCSYCIVPLVRGPSRSLSPQRVMEHLAQLKGEGFQEVVLTGIHLGAYGHDLHPPSSLGQLVERLESEDTPARIRLSSIDPLDVTPDLISLLSKSSKVCPHLHIPIQSAEDEILGRMNRNYDRRFLSELFERLSQSISGISIGADVIVGFPGETEEKFEKTYQWIQAAPVSYLHVFPFSRREGTPAADLDRQVPAEEIRRRAKRMRELGREKRRSFYSRFLHHTLEVLVEGREMGGRGPARWKGHSRNYLPVFLTVDGERDLSNREVKVFVTGWNDRGVVGHLTEGDDG